MYAIQTHREHARRWQTSGERGESLVWRARWALLATAAVGLLGIGYAREAVGSPLVGVNVPVAAETVTVAPGDTLWDIATSRYPGADVRQKVFEIEQLNGLSGPSIEAGQRLRVPAS